MSQLLRQGEPAEALQMLFDNPKLAWQKDEYSGGYPIHIATFKVGVALGGQAGPNAGRLLCQVIAGLSESFWGQACR